MKGKYTAKVAAYTGCPNKFWMDTFLKKISKVLKKEFLNFCQKIHQIEGKTAPIQNLLGTPCILGIAQLDHSIKLIAYLYWKGTALQNLPILKTTFELKSSKILVYPLILQYKSCCEEQPWKHPYRLSNWSEWPFPTF